MEIYDYWVETIKIKLKYLNNKKSKVAKYVRDVINKVEKETVTVLVRNIKNVSDVYIYHKLYNSYTLRYTINGHFYLQHQWQWHQC